MLEVTVNLCDALTPKSCSKLVIHLIKYILYHSEQIPMNYESLNNLLKKFHTAVNGENVFASMNTLNKMKAHKFYKSVDSLLSSCERTFEFLDCELKESQGIRELVVIVGATIISPKKIIRIVIPNMSFEGCDKEHPAGRNLHSLCKHIVTSDTVHDYFQGKIGPTNIFIFFKMHSRYQPKTDWFLPREEFRFSTIGKHIRIILEQPEANICSCLELLNDGSRNRISDVSCAEFKGNGNLVRNDDLFTWYQSKVLIKGLGDCKGKAATTAINLLLKNKS